MFTYAKKFAYAAIFASAAMFVLCRGDVSFFGDFKLTQLYSPSQEDPDEHIILSRFLSNPNLRASADRCEEQQTPICDPNMLYRTYDGTCNNLQYPTWGSVNDCLLRILPAAYEGQYGMRRPINGGSLPTPRDLSLKVFTKKENPLPNVTLLFTAFGQIIAHDQSLSAPAAGPDLTRGSGIQCCPVSKANNSDCSAIEIREDDPFFSKVNITCIEFLRGLKCTSCKNTGKQLITNIVTGALDLSLVYGLGQEEAEKLKTKDGTGRLKARYTEKGELLPQNTNPDMFFCPVMETSSCFNAGDVRVNQHTYLAILQTALAREHNRMVTELKVINPHWNDETLYQTGRRILGAKYQAMVFNEYAPVLLGEENMDEFKLWVTDEGESTRYDPTLRFGTWTEHATGTFRAHSMIPTNTGYGTKLFMDMYSNNHPILDGEMSQVIHGSCKVSSQQYDHFEAPDVVDLMYKQPKDNYGLDLVAIDIHRGRDHGLPPYIYVLNYCSLSDSIVTEFDHLREVMTQENIEILKENYGSVYDVDLYVGMQMETIKEGSVLPPTSACVVGGHFYFAKYGDRFYFEHANQAPSFTDAQREALKKSTIARLLCDNTGIKYLQKNPLLFESETNPVLPCWQHPEVDLNLWKTLA